MQKMIVGLCCLVLCLLPMVAHALTATLTWIDVANETLYRVQQSVDGGATWTTLGTTAANVTTFVQTTGFVEGQQYCFQVRGENGSLLGQYSDPLCSIPNTPAKVGGLFVNWTP